MSAQGGAVPAPPPARFAPAALARFVSGVFEAEGLSPAHAGMVADALVSANLRGVDTHGVFRVPAYLKRLRAGLLNPRPNLQIECPAPTTLVLDADNAMGPVAAFSALDACLERAAQFGMGAATVRRSNHFGAAAAYTLRAAEQGCIGIVMSPGSRTLAPHGSRAALLGTHPFAVAVPSGRYAPFSLDMAASVAARGHVRVAATRGQPIPEGWALDAEGRPTTDALAALGGVMLPFGGAKGSGLAMMVDIFAAVLAGSAFAGDVRDWVNDFEGPADVGHFLLAIRVDAFLPAEAFARRMETAIERLKALPPAEGFDEVLYPGERAARTGAERSRAGIPLTPASRAALEELAGPALPFPDPLGPDALPDALIEA